VKKISTNKGEKEEHSRLKTLF